ncbi:hypothetical protein KTJ32_12930, partial [Acinetobacter gyllenbergii]|uniref:hypothetical protein n=1 Tax=Acinetobacter gyllenbergii TaxID=134534 RepID=UPI0021D198D2
HVRVSHRQLLNLNTPSAYAEGVFFIAGRKENRKNVVHSGGIFHSYIKQIALKEQIWFIN